MRIRIHAVPLFTAILFALIVRAPAYGACSRETCHPVGPGTACEQYLYNNLFDDNACSAWQSTGYALLRTEGSDKFYDIYARTSTLYQSIGIHSQWTSFELRVQMAVVSRSTAGSERLHVEIRDASTNSLLETIAVWYPASAADGVYTFYTANNYSNSSIKVQFRLVQGSTPGDTYFRIKDVYLWTR